MTNAQERLRNRINDALIQSISDPPVSNFETVEVLIAMAVSLQDWNGGEDDTEHAIKTCHRLVDKFRPVAAK